MIVINQQISIPDSEISFTFITSSGPGGQNVNKVATAVLLRFNVRQSLALPEAVRTRLCQLLGKRLTADGECLIKASCHRTQARNREDALARLIALIQRAAIVPRRRKRTKPTAASIEARLASKKRKGVKKAERRRATKSDFS